MSAIVVNLDGRFVQAGPLSEAAASMHRPGSENFSYLPQAKVQAKIT